MMFPLAHDDTGTPLEVPAEAVGWLVRRHSGGKGRPAAVYDVEGRPLVVGLDATAADLRAEGCKPGPYRLDAVDEGRRPLGVVGFTEVMGSRDGAEEDGGPRSASDAAIMALARAVEAMQRVQAERERMQAEMFARLIERLTPPAPQPAQDLRNALGQVVELKETLDALTEEEDESGGAAAGSPLEALAGTIGAALPAVVEMLGAKYGTGGGGSAAGGAAVVSTGAVATRNAAARVVAGAEVSAEAEVAEGAGKLDLVLAQLSAAELEKAGRLIRRLTPEMRASIFARFGALPVDAAAEALRSFLASVPDEAAGAVAPSAGGEEA